MKSILQNSNPIPEWQRERAMRLHRICSSIDLRVNRGEKKKKLVQWFAWYWKGRCYKCDPGRKLNFTFCAINRAFRIWKRSGQIAAVLIPAYKPRHSVFTAPVLTRFVNFFFEHPHSTMKAAWEKFCARGGNFGCGRRAGKPLKISYGQLRYAFRAAIFYQAKREHRAIETANAALAGLRARAIADVCRRFPERPPRKRLKREMNFEI